jgi:hypothetical protein
LTLGLARGLAVMDESLLLVMPECRLPDPSRYPGTFPMESHSK